MSRVILSINPKKIVFCTPTSAHCEHTHSKLNADHPHADVNRGWFDVGPVFPKVVSQDWDGLCGPQFEQLIEYKSIYNHYHGIEYWRYSEFASRIVKWAEKGGPLRDLGVPTSDMDRWLELREKQIDQLITSISNGFILSELYENNIGINITRHGNYLFNNVGHHRLAICKCLGIYEIPVIPIVSYKKLDRS